MDFIFLLPFIAFALDMALGDPQGWPHPVRLIGRALDRLEKYSHSLFPPSEGDRGKSFPPAGAGRSPAKDALASQLNKSAETRTSLQVRRISMQKRLFGLFAVILLSFGAYFAVLLLTRLPIIGWLFSLYFAYAGLALGQLLREARNVSHLIESGQLDEARRQLSFLVSRDTSVLDEPGLWRTLAETVSENFCDAFVAPLTYLFLGGPQLLWFYKSVSTMDSMWGYKTERFVDLGWAGARTDDVLAFIPARLSAYALIVSGFVLRLPAGKALLKFKQDARTMSSPNAGWPMAAAAWLCGASMGGPAVYFGTSVEKPLLGPAGSQWDIFRFKTLLRMIFVAGIGMVLSFQALLSTLACAFS
ncbi:MAG: cobalamin biosynthesis protein [Desulfovibrio sp.]|nr:cobalamin biosynthesis protein [Desulfovibrio sp.]MBI4960078.1 cobalamin biosynthesis protein [Desulfovibrio sp.]